MSELKLEVESLDGIPEQYHAAYVQEDGVFKFRLPEVEDVTGLKNTVEATRKERDEAKRKLKELEEAKNKDLESKLEENQQYKELAENRKQEVLSLKEQLENFYKDSATDRIVATLTDEPKQAEVLKNMVSKNLQYVDGNVIVSGIAEVTTPEQLQEYYKETYPFLVGGSKASGGGANGNQQDRGTVNVKTQEQIDAMNPREKMEFFKGGGKVKQ